MSDATTLKMPFLPISWALLFFASLCVVVAHSIFQARVPDIIAKYSSDEYAEKVEDRYRETESDADFKKYCVEEPHLIAKIHQSCFRYLEWLESVGDKWISDAPAYPPRNLIPEDINELYVRLRVETDGDWKKMLAKSADDIGGRVLNTNSDNGEWIHQGLPSLTSKERIELVRDGASCSYQRRSLGTSIYAASVCTVLYCIAVILIIIVMVLQINSVSSASGLY